MEPHSFEPTPVATSGREVPVKIRVWKGPKEENRGGKAGSKREAGVGGVIITREEQEQARHCVCTHAGWSQTRRL